MTDFDIRWINIESDLSATVDDGTGPPSVEFPDPVEIDPWVFAISFGYLF